MRHVTVLLTICAALALPPAARAQAAECDEARPVVSEGLPTRPCASTVPPVIVNRGPEVVPEPSEAAPEEPERRVYRVRTPGRSDTERASRSDRRLPVYAYYPPYRPAPEPYFRLELEKGDVRLIIGSGDYRPYPPRHPHPPHHDPQPPKLQGEVRR